MLSSLQHTACYWILSWQTTGNSEAANALAAVDSCVLSSQWSMLAIFSGSGVPVFNLDWTYPESPSMLSAVNFADPSSCRFNRLPGSNVLRRLKNDSLKCIPSVG